GTINEDSFRIVSSERGTGALCVLDGTIKNQKGRIDIYINKTFKYLFSIILLFPVIALIVISATEGISLNILFLCLLQFAFIRFAFIGLFFYILSKRSVNKLADVLDAKSLSVAYNHKSFSILIPAICSIPVGLFTWSYFELLLISIVVEGRMLTHKEISSPCCNWISFGGIINPAATSKLP